VWNCKETVTPAKTAADKDILCKRSINAGQKENVVKWGVLAPRKRKKRGHDRKLCEQAKQAPRNEARTTHRPNESEDGKGEGTLRS